MITFSHLDRTPACDGQTDGRTQRYSTSLYGKIYCGSIASRDKTMQETFANEVAKWLLFFVNFNIRTR